MNFDSESRISDYHLPFLLVEARRLGHTRRLMGAETAEQCLTHITKEQCGRRFWPVGVSQPTVNIYLHLGFAPFDLHPKRALAGVDTHYR